jgi:hypothetical protein
VDEVEWWIVTDDSTCEHSPDTIVASVPFPQAARSSVKGYEHRHGYKIRFETTWLDKP